MVFWPPEGETSMRRILTTAAERIRAAVEAIRAQDPLIP